MSRSCFSFHYTSFDRTKTIIDSKLIQNGYKYKNENGEYVWKCGVGFLTAMKYIKIEFSENQIVNIYGWIRATAGSEQNLEGIVGSIPKKQILKLIKKIGESIV